MRDLRKFRTKLNLELDNRQIAFLLAGLLAVLAIVFALGLVVGKGLSRLDGEKVATAGSQPALDMPTPKQIVAEPLEVKEGDLPKGPVELTPSPNDPTINVLNSEAPPPAGAPPASSFPLPVEEPKAAPPPPAPEPAPPPASENEIPSPPKGSGWTVQLSAHPSEAEALSRQKAYVAKGIQAYLVKAAIPGKGVWYRVRVGQFSTKQGAQQYRDAIAAKEGIQPIVQPIQ